MLPILPQQPRKGRHMFHFLIQFLNSIARYEHISRKEFFMDYFPFSPEFFLYPAHWMETRIIGFVSHRHPDLFFHFIFCSCSYLYHIIQNNPPSSDKAYPFGHPVKHASPSMPPDPICCHSHPFVLLPQTPNISYLRYPSAPAARIPIK